MIIERILENTNYFKEKVAIRYGSKMLTYSQLAKEINQRSAFFENQPCKYYLDDDCQLENLLNLLAIMFFEKSAVIFPKELTDIDKQSIIKNYNLSPINDKWEALAYEKPLYFLGVLSSGSTAIPKLIWKSNDCWEAAFKHQSDLFQVSKDDNVLVLDALAYSANLNSVLHALWVGASVHFVNLKKAKRWGEYIDEQAITSVFLVPSHLNLLVHQPFKTNLKSVVTAGEKLSANLANLILEKFNGVLLTEYYGTSELGHITYHQNREITDNPLTVGSNFPEVDIEIVDNQLFVKSPYVSPEYINIWTVGDLGSWYEDKLCLLGREGRMYNRRGLNVFAQEIESKAMELPCVKNAIMIGAKNSTNPSHTLYLFFETNIKNDKNKNSLKLLNEYLKAVLPSNKRPQKIIELKSFPKKPNGKINRKLLEELIDKPTIKEVDISCNN